ncbi:MAG: TonB-dependent receptor [Prevotellaceae bacterium]|jgi:iron complex outermembrane receptor protein|nr:TonB-dependent receptor [Prevotellaceae bacterium]
MKKHLTKHLQRIIFVLFCCIFPLNIFAQNIQISGSVSDISGEAIVGATVIVKGTSNGTITDIEGKFNLSNVSENAILVVSFIGYITQEFNFSKVQNFGKVISIVLEEDTKILDEVVAIGYGVVKKNDATGSVTAINADLKGRGLAPNAQDMMIGKIAGVSITSGGGSATDGATIRIRGGSSLSASNDPLIVVDGIPLGGGPGGVGNMLSSINPTDIETFTILKDASATAIYGSRASNGVIIITTKKGTSGKVKITYDGNVSFSQRKNQVDVLSGDEFRDFIQTTYLGKPNEAEAVSKLGQYNTDWQSEIFRTGVNTEHNLSVYGSVKDIMPYRASFGYTKLNGILKTEGLERYTASVSLSPTLFNKHLSINVNAKGMYIKNRFANRGAIGTATVMDPTQPVYQEDRDENSPFGGYWTWVNNMGEINGQGTINPVAMLEMVNDRSKVYQFIGNAQFDYKVHFLPDLHLNLNLGLDYSQAQGTYISPLESPMQAAVKYEIQRDWKETRRNPLIDFYALYKKEFERHAFDVTAGYSWQHFWHKNPAVEQHIGEYLEDGTPVVVETNSPSELYLISFFGRANYSFLNRYLFTATIRTDGSSRFVKENRWGIFPAAAFAWKINEEKFLKDIHQISNLKLRLGWGITGQQDIGFGDYPALALYQQAQGYAAKYLLDGEWVDVIRPSAYNANLTWEKTTTYNAGIDFGFLRNRISGSIEFYHRVTRDLINTEVRKIAGTNFAEFSPENIGSLKNDGIEFTLNTVPISKKNWEWRVDFNVAYNKNKIIDLAGGGDDASNRIGSTSGSAGGTALKIHKIGYGAAMYYVYEQVYDNNGSPIEGMYVDRNNDGKINEQDLYIYHNSTPDVILGFTTSLRYKSFDLKIASHGSLGNYNYNGMDANHAATSEIYRNQYLSNVYQSALYTNYQLPQVLSDYYIQNASFFRIDNITLGWNFEKSKKFPLSGRIYASVQNPFIFTNYSGLDPEIFGGVDVNFYPRPVSYMFGVNITF